MNIVCLDVSKNIAEGLRGGTFVMDDNTQTLALIDSFKLQSHL